MEYFDIMYDFRSIYICVSMNTVYYNTCDHTQIYYYAHSFHQNTPSRSIIIISHRQIIPIILFLWSSWFIAIIWRCPTVTSSISYARTLTYTCTRPREIDRSLITVLYYRMHQGYKEGRHESQIPHGLYGHFLNNSSYKIHRNIIVVCVYKNNLDISF